MMPVESDADSRPKPDDSLEKMRPTFEKVLSMLSDPREELVGL